MLRKKIFLALLTMTTLPAYAMFCPNGFNQIQIGDTLDQVKQQCGKPTAEVETESKAKQPQEWNYYVQVNPQAQATLKTTIAFVKGVVTNMSVNGIGVSSTSVCKGNNIQIGFTQEQIKQACGTPAFINEGTQTEPPIKVTEVTYGTETLIFENGLLKGQK